MGAWRAAVSCLLAVGLVGCDATEPTVPTGVGPTRGAIRAPAGSGQTPAKAIRAPSSAPDLFGSPVAPPAPSAPTASPTDGGLPTDGGAPVTDDHALAAAVENQSRSLVGCIPTSIPTLPDVSIEFQISVAGYVTRSDVSGGGLDRAVLACLSHAAEGIRFPEQTAPRSYRYPLKLRRVDAGAPSPAPAPR